MSHIEVVKALLEENPALADTPFFLLAAKLAVLVDHYEAAGREPESIWDRDFRAVICTMNFEPKVILGCPAAGGELFETAVRAADEMQRIRAARRGK